MPRDASGNFSLPPVYLATPGTTIRAEQHNTPFQDVAQALTESMPRNGSAPMTGNLSMGGRRITSVGAPTANGDATTKQYVDNAVRTGATVTPERIQMSRDGIVARPQSGEGPAQLVVLGNGVEFNSGLLRAAIGSGLSFVSGLITAAVSRFATSAEAAAGASTAGAMTPQGTRQFADANLFAMGQAWRNVTADRAAGVTYTNATGRPIEVNVRFQSGTLEAAVPGSGNWIVIGASEQNPDGRQFQSATIPSGHVYRVQASSIITWSELR